MSQTSTSPTYHFTKYSVGNRHIQQGGYPWLAHSYFDVASTIDQNLKAQTK